MKISNRFTHRGLAGSQETRHLIIHYHIFKNAGTTVNIMLLRHFGLGYGEYDGKKLAGVIPPQALLSFILRNPQLKVLSSHNARLPAPQYPGITVYPLIFLRHPIDRIGSMYSFERRQPPGTSLTSVFAHEHTFAEYVRFFIHNSKFFMKNFQTHFLCGKVVLERTKKSITKPIDVHIAKKRLSSLLFFGIVEYFDESLEMMRDYLMDGFGEINMAYTVENKSPGRQSTLEERLDTIRTELGADLYQELEAHNSMDMRLYEFGKSLFLNRLAEKKLPQAAASD